MFWQFFCHLQFWFIQSTKLNESNLHLIINFIMLIWNFPCNCIVTLFCFYCVLSNEHFVIHFKFNFVFCINQNWRWKRNCQNMFLKIVEHFLQFLQVAMDNNSQLIQSLQASIPRETINWFSQCHWVFSMEALCQESSNPMTLSKNIKNNSGLPEGKCFSLEKFCSLMIDSRVL